ncbi:esterase/lipase family protein [Leptothrix sp. BB-4]
MNIMNIFRKMLTWMLLALSFTASAVTPPSSLFVKRADGMLIMLQQRVEMDGKYYFLYSEPFYWGNGFNKRQSMHSVATILGKGDAKSINQLNRSAFMQETTGQGYAVTLPTEGELRDIFSHFKGPPYQWNHDNLDGCCEFWSATRNWNDHSTVLMWNNATQSRWDTDARIVAFQVKPMTREMYESEGQPPRVLLLHGLFGDGDSIMGSAYFPDLTGWITAATGRAPIIPKMGDANLDMQYERALARMKGECPSGCRWHLVGHSRGGLVARMIMEKNPAWVASITTVATPHRGCPLCDLTSDSKVVKDFIGLFTSTGAPAQVVEMSQAKMEKFNQTYRAGVPDGVNQCKQWRVSPKDYFHSRLEVGGFSIHAAAIVGNRFGNAGEEFGAFWSNLLDPTYWMNHVVGAVGADDGRYSSANDGVVPQCSAGFGAKGSEGMNLGAVDHNDTVFQLARMSTTRGVDALKGHLNWLFENVR